MPLRVLDHPLAGHLVAHLRDRTTKPATFRTLAHQLTTLLAIEATRDLETEEREIATPLETDVTDADVGKQVGYVGLERDHETARARSYYCKLPPVAGRHVFVIDPMLATGGSAAQAIRVVREHGAADVRLVAIVSAPEGVAEVERQHPGTVIHTAALDRGLNDRKYILPGLGDFGDRLYGT